MVSKDLEFELKSFIIIFLYFVVFNIRFSVQLSRMSDFEFWSSFRFLSSLNSFGSDVLPQLKYFA